MYDSLVNAMNSKTATWKLPKDSRAHWIKCSYRGTTLELSKELPSTFSSCVVDYDSEAGSGLPYIKTITCN